MDPTYKATGTRPKVRPRPTARFTAKPKPLVGSPEGYVFIFTL
jgi:hypothetical protein